MSWRVGLLVPLLGLGLGFCGGAVASASTSGWAAGTVAARPAQLAQPAQGQPEPPEVRGLRLPVAREAVVRRWYPNAPTLVIVLVEPAVPAGVAEDDAVVTDQVVVQYLGQGDDVNPRAVIRLVVGTAVPELVGLTAEEARERAEAVGLSVGVGGDPGGRVASQEPAAGVVVRFGSGVRVQLAAVATTEPPVGSAPAAPTPRWPWVALAGGGLLVLVGGGGVALRQRQRRRRAEPARTVRCEPHPDPRPELSVRAVGDGIDLSFRVRPRADAGTVTVEERP